MKKAILLFALFNVCCVVFSQETEGTTEIKQETKEVRRTRLKNKVKRNKNWRKYSSIFLTGNQLRANHKT